MFIPIFTGDYAYLVYQVAKWIEKKVDEKKK